MNRFLQEELQKVCRNLIMFKRYNLQIEYEMNPAEYPVRICVYRSKEQIYLGTGPHLLPLLKQAAAIIHRHERETLDARPWR